MSPPDPSPPSCSTSQSSGMFVPAGEKGRVLWFNTDCVWADEEYGLVGLVGGARRLLGGDPGRAPAARGVQTDPRGAALARGVCWPPPPFFFFFKGTRCSFPSWVMSPG
ncbi:unnamed protein product [Ectocarpus sp. 8 AP-2014]